METARNASRGKTPDVTGLLSSWRGGDAGAISELMPAVYSHLRQLAERAMRGERRDHTLQATALVHEAFMRLSESAPIQWTDRRHFYAVAAGMMRRILVDHARALRTERRGAGWQKVQLGESDPVGKPPEIDLLALDEALDRLHRVDARKAQVVELRFFGGLSVAETAEVLAVSKPTIVLDTRLARAWLFSRLEESRDAQ
ncbi:MAG: sigma-70 family RNA polymerase sigma factor [Acidobacteriota bacterium]